MYFFVYKCGMQCSCLFVIFVLVIPIFSNFPTICPIFTFFPRCFLSVFFMNSPVIAFGMNCLVAISIDISNIIIAIVASMFVIILVIPYCCSTMNIVIPYIMYSLSLASSSLSGLNPAACSILLISASQSIFFTSFPASFAIISPKNIVIIAMLALIPIARNVVIISIYLIVFLVVIKFFI